MRTRTRIVIVISVAIVTATLLGIIPILGYFLAPKPITLVCSTYEQQYAFAPIAQPPLHVSSNLMLHGSDPFTLVHMQDLKPDPPSPIYEGVLIADSTQTINATPYASEITLHQGDEVHGLYVTTGLQIYIFPCW